MRVITLDDKAFSRACAALSAQVLASGYRYDLLVGIATGGAIVAREMPAPQRVEVRRQRPSTRAKQRLAGQLLRHMPRPLSDRLRVAESRLYALMARHHKPGVPEVTLDQNTLETIRGLNDREERPRILIVDDAVDSGATMLGVLRAVAAAAPAAEIRTAAITQTRDNPLIRPDYLHFAERVLVRFPWSADMQK